MPESLPLESLLSELTSSYSDIIPVDLKTERIFPLDLGPANKELSSIDLTSNRVFQEYLDENLVSTGCTIAAGGYNEQRVLYRMSDHFGSGDDARIIHLGLDIWISASTPLFVPLDGTVHSFANNSNYRDYGPTIILEHNISGVLFHTLFGHLSLESLEGKYRGMKLKAGEEFAKIGSSAENGTWPPHVHFQIIRDIGDWQGDFPGVSSISERDKFLSLCPDPNLLLGLNLGGD